MSAAGPNSKPLKSAFANKRKQGSSGDNGGGNNGAGGGGGGGGGWAQKRVKIRQDREIAAQSSDAALRDGELDLQSFLNAREFEIRALEESMRHTKAEATSRAFQQVPRGLRRRTASHNAKRVPKRLRRRALKEMAEDNTPVVLSKRRKPKTTRARIRAETAKRLGMLAEKKRRRAMKAEKAKAKDKDGEGDTDKTGDDGPGKGAVTVTTRPPRPKIRRNQLNDPPQRKSKFRKRQINKTWLPTHLWHAKRARMTEPANPLWRFAIPLTPNEKTYRATHRSHGGKGTVVWDTSYVSTIGLYGSAKGVEQVLRRLGVAQESCWNERGRKWREGTRHWSGFLSREVKGGSSGVRREVCPATILWNPLEPVAEDGGQSQTAKVQRQVFVRVHPSAFLEVFNELLRLVKMQNPRMYIEDLRFEIGSIELTGPASTEALLGILHPYHTQEGSREQHADIFKSLNSLMSPASLPLNATLGFSIMDPRLRYPPRKVAQPDPDDEEEQNKSLDLLANWPADTNLKPYGLFHRDARASATRLPSQKSIDRRKGARRPGTDLGVSDADPPIPIILVASRAAGNSSNGNSSSQGNWTVLAPWRCIQPLWHSLVHFPLSSGGNPRFSGLDQIRQVAFERATPCFPFDFLGTDAGAAWEVEQRRLRKASWERRPKSKRVAWASLDLGAGRKGEVGCGWACDVEFLFWEETTTDKKEKRSAALDADEMDVDKPSPVKEEASAAAGDAASEGEFLKTLQHIRKDAFKAHTSSPSPATPPPLPPRSVINVKISILNRGVATACARIYRLPPRPAPTAPTSSAEIPATVPPPPAPTTSVQGSDSSSSSSGLPTNLRVQWLATLPVSSASAKHSTKKNGKATHQQHQQTKHLPLETQKQILAQKLLASPLAEASSLLPAKPNQTDMNGHHPLVPDEEDLIGFVTTGSYCLAEGRGTAIGCLSAEKAAEAVRDGGGGREGTLCIVRNAGESVGWIARWEVV
ncbi:POPLD domain-containing protein [Colletotrichum scovillei]|uniref:POPLD domain-containing protein n=1 Tax=Colletotrichum scovillei TaxID=1209932 RepID=A0A9P7RH89_9PEZI|nr:POPLD domain-containing protein [Colletotrichum scovillei]KAF4779629.1 POPLD domain-containing protein [Colletotrichum scovillei]KAG7058488.1 POPLD domain-containing protein [Colletotrichum scovillei]KAG7077090.1 POPLD domain-containing protein [Colletotrichum scovillei]KAG7084199.1 POPLD domain-containing protein [Colletotrichum scovillei]